MKKPILLFLVLLLYSTVQAETAKIDSSFSVIPIRPVLTPNAEPEPMTEYEREGVRLMLEHLERMQEKSKETLAYHARELDTAYRIEALEAKVDSLEKWIRRLETLLPPNPLEEATLIRESVIDLSPLDTIYVDVLPAPLDTVHTLGGGVKWDGICPACKKLGWKSIVTERGYATQTLLASPPVWYDEDGKAHVPKDPNQTTQTYECSKGHTFTRSW